MVLAITVKPFGPHQCFMRSGSVKAFQTSSRGAAKTRLMMNAPSAPVALALVVRSIAVTVVLLLVG